MTRRTDEDEGGAAFAEYAVLLAGIAIVCIVSVIFIGSAVSWLFSPASKPGEPGVFRPPTVSQLSWPRTIEECEDGGWRNFAQFADEEACKDYVESLGP